MRLQTLIGTSDHTIQWMLTGDVSQVNYRIYQVVLVFVSFEPHFIKFCDIMEVLAAGSITSGYIQELRKSESVCIATYLAISSDKHFCKYCGPRQYMRAYVHV